MKTLRLCVTVFFIAALSNPFFAYAGSADDNGDQGTKTKPISEPDPDCDHTNGLPSDCPFRLTL